MSDGDANGTQSEALTCFVIGPIGDRLAPTGDPARRRFEEAEELWEYVIEPACAENGLSPIRADKIAHPGEIPEQIFQLLRDADVVIADLTGGNANVMYELGLRHTRDRITIQIGENERLPFDINTIRTFRFRRTTVGLAEVRDQLSATLKAALEGKGTPVTATRVWGDEAAPTASLVSSARARERELADSITELDEDEDDEPGLIDVLADGEAALGEIGAVLGRIGAATVRMGAIGEEVAANVAEADAKHGTFAARLSVARKFADLMQEPTGELEETAADYVEVLSRIDPAVQRLISIAEQDPGARTELEEYLASVAALSTVTEGSMASTSEMARTYAELGKVSNVMKPVCKRVERAMRRVAAASDVMAEWGRRVRALPDWDESKVEAVLASWETPDEPTEPGGSGDGS